MTLSGVSSYKFDVKDIDIVCRLTFQPTRAILIAYIFVKTDDTGNMLAYGKSCIKYYKMKKLTILYQLQ